MKKKNVSISIFITFSACLIYWVFVVVLASYYQEKANDYGMKGLLYQVQGNDKEHDSLFILFYHYLELSDKTLLAIPKFVRP